MFDGTSPMDVYRPLKFRAPTSVQGAPAGTEGIVRNDTLGLPARVAGDVWVGEVLRCGWRGEGDNQGDSDQKLLHFKSPLAC